MIQLWFLTLLKILRIYSKIIKFESLSSTCHISNAGRWKTLGVPVVIGGDNLPSPLQIGLSDLTNIGGGGQGPPWPPRFRHHCNRMGYMKESSTCNKWCLTFDIILSHTVCVIILLCPHIGRPIYILHTDIGCQHILALLKILFAYILYRHPICPTFFFWTWFWIIRYTTNLL